MLHVLFSRYGGVRIAGGRVTVVQASVGDTNTHGIVRRCEALGSPVPSNNGTDWLWKGATSMYEGRSSSKVSDFFFLRTGSR
jgi:hypothetical protein